MEESFVFDVGLGGYPCRIITESSAFKKSKSFGTGMYVVIIVPFDSLIFAIFLSYNIICKMVANIKC